MNGGWILASDIGTSSVKTAVFRHDGVIIDSETVSHQTAHPQAGWAEQRPEDWWSGYLISVNRLAERHPELSSKLCVIGVSGQMLGCVAIGRDGQALFPALIHADTRSAAQADLISSQIGSRNLYTWTGNRLDARSGLAKWLWLEQNYPDVEHRAFRLLQAKDFIVGRLVGSYDATDRSDAAHAQWSNIHTHEYLDTVMTELGLDSSKLPAIHCGSDCIGRLCHSAAAALGLPDGIPVIAGAGDGACASVGAGSSLAGDAYACLGTTAWISYTDRQPFCDPGMRLFNLPSADGQTCGVYGTAQSAGHSVSWAMALLGFTTPSELDAAAASVPPGSEGLVFLPYLDGERTPVYDTDARGLFFGISARHGRGHFARAVLEGVAMALANIVLVLREQVDLPALRLIGGGARSMLWRRMIAAAGRISLERISVPAGDATAYGCAMTAAVGIGLYPDLRTAQAGISRLDEMKPDDALAAVFDRMYPVYAALYAANKPVFDLAATLRRPPAP